MLFSVAFLLVTSWVFFGGTLGGFCPMDEGLVLAQTHRVLHGQLPHVDFFTPRPALSAVLHLVDHLVPMPLFRASRLIAVLEIAAYTTVLAALVFRCAPGRWGAAQVLGWATALLMNVHGFPMMAWYTIDGILLVAAGFALVRRGAEREAGVASTCGFLLLGAAPLTKQSFFLAPIMGAVELLACSRPLVPALRWRALRRAIVVAAIPGIVYATVVVARGGLEPMRTQLLGAAPTWGTMLLLPLATASFQRRLLMLAAALLATSACDALGRRAGYLGAVGRLTSLALRGGISLALLGPALTQELTWQWAWSGWGAETLWMAAVVFVWRAVVTRAVDGVAVALLVLGWMTALSWGYANPNLVAGSLALGAAWSVWRDAPAGLDAHVGLVRAGAVLLALVAFLASARAFATARSRPYFDRPVNETVVDLGTISPALAGIRTNDMMSAFLRDLTDCIARHPARWVTVVPDNTWIYAALGLTNPLPFDWLYPPEYGLDKDGVLRRASWLEKQGDYLVVFAPLPAYLLCRHEGPLPTARLPYTPQGYGDGLPTGIWQTLSGRRVPCGSMYGKWKPASSRRMGKAR